MFESLLHARSMTNALTPNLRLATADEVAETLVFALRYNARKHVHNADDAMGRITAARLVQHLEASEFVVMKKLPASASTTSHMPSSIR